MADGPDAKRQRTSGDERRARVCVAGAGWWAQYSLIPQLSRNTDTVTLTAIIEPSQNPRSTLKKDMKSTEELASTYGVPIFKTVDEFLRSDAAKTTNAIVIATTHAVHHEIGMKAIKAGMHILMEKPMTTDPTEALELARAVEGYDKAFIVNHSANFRENSIKARELVQNGEIGTIQHVRCFMGSALLWLFDNPENVGWVTPTGGMLGNGFGWGQMSHTLAWVFMVTDLAPKSVYCQMVYSEKTGADLFCSGVVRCTNGATINFEGAAALPFESYDKSTKQIDNKIFGTEGMLTYSGEDFFPDSGALILQRHDGKHKRFDGFYFENYLEPGLGSESLQAFISAARGLDVVNAANATIGFKAVQTIEAMYRSAKSNKPEDVVQ